MTHTNREDENAHNEMKAQKRLKDENDHNEMVARKRLELKTLKEELEKCLDSQRQHGSRVRATIRDPVAGRLVVETNRENTHRINVAKKRIKTLVKWLR